MITKIADWQRPPLDLDNKIADTVSQMLANIREQGDTAIDHYAQNIDAQSVEVVQLKAFEAYALKPQLAEAIKLAAKRIEKFAEFQKDSNQSKNFSDEFGEYGQVISPIERIGAYIPGGRFPLISTALMTLIPARVAGCKIRIACSPSNHPAILAAASLAGATQFIHIGGVQAIAALAYGYGDYKPVDMVVGPGNAWVNEAKKQLQAVVKIDGLAGPSELLALCDKEQPIGWLASDALAQAEHDPMACSIIASDDSAWLTDMLAYLETKPETERLLKDKQIALVYAESSQELIEFSEAYAPEHLMLCHKQIKEDELGNYGSLFVGANSAVALGDYISGPNHTLPTLGYARQTGGLSVSSFLRVKTIQKINDSGRESLSKSAAEIADAEGLVFHRQSLELRCKNTVN